MRETVNVYIRLSKLALEMVEQRADSKRISRASWLRDAVLRQLQETQNYEALDAMENRLLTKLNHAVNAINAHVTSEIDELTRT